MSNDTTYNDTYDDSFLEEEWDELDSDENPKTGIIPLFIATMILTCVLAIIISITAVVCTFTYRYITQNYIATDQIERVTNEGF